MASVASLLCSNQLDRKRTHGQMSSECRHTPCNTHHRDTPHHNTHSSSSSLFNINIPPNTRRGFDLRRPIMSQPRRDIIDLTEDTSSPPEAQTIPPAPTSREASTLANRPPRFDRNIINIDDHEDDSVDLREESPEIQFLTSRPRSRSLNATSRLARRRPGLTPATRSPIRRPQVAVRVTAGDRNSHQPVAWSDALHIQLPRSFHSNFGGPTDEEMVAFENFPGGVFQVPENLNFLQAGFDYDQPSRPQQQPGIPTYEPPPPAKPGFTRSPAEDDTLVCPHCDDELGEGITEEKRQVWAVKACGHVYCGECATNRSVKQSSLTGSRRVKPWSKCVVEDCGKSVTHARSVFQVYL